MRATVKGSLLVAMAQGALGGLMFWLLDIRAESGAPRRVREKVDLDHLPTPEE